MQAGLCCDRARVLRAATYSICTHMRTLSHDPRDAYLLTYGYGNISVKAAANALFGREDIVGTLPVNLNEEYVRGTGLKRPKRVSEFKKKEKSKDYRF